MGVKELRVEPDKRRVEVRRAVHPNFSPFVTSKSFNLDCGCARYARPQEITYREGAMSTTQIIIEESDRPQTLSPFRTRWGRELAVHEGNPDFVLSLARGLR